MANDVKIKSDSTDWRQQGFDPFVSRSATVSNKPTDYIPGAQFEVQLDEMLFNRMIKLKDLRVKPQGNDPGKIYWDGDNQKFKIWVGDGKWADVVYTSTSTSSSSSSSSSSTSSTSSSTSSTSSSSSSSSSTSTTI
jgi:hypothetical protein